MDIILQAFSELASHLKDPLVLIGFAFLLAVLFLRTLFHAKPGIVENLSQNTSGKAVLTTLRYGYLLALVVVLLGFGLAFYRIYQGTPPPIDVKAIIEQLEAKHLQEQAGPRKIGRIGSNRPSKLSPPWPVCADSRTHPPGLTKSWPSSHKAGSQKPRSSSEPLPSAGKRTSKRPPLTATWAPWPFCMIRRRPWMPIAGPHSWTRPTRRAGIGSDAYCTGSESWTRPRGPTSRSRSSARPRGIRNRSQPPWATWALSIKPVAIWIRPRPCTNRHWPSTKSWGTKKGLATNYSNLGALYGIRGDWDQADTMYRKALVFFQKLGAVPKIEGYGSYGTTRKNLATKA